MGNLLPFYSSTKWAVTALCRAFQNELFVRQSHIRVTGWIHFDSSDKTATNFRAASGSFIFGLRAEDKKVVDRLSVRKGHEALTLPV
ncbi:hypothetical protein J6590_064039 [Homalodisca vitripennis]|nr:hypothetical protein J6590_064039 [Homalodisca vitripennis]